MQLATILNRYLLNPLLFDTFSWKNNWVF